MARDRIEAKYDTLSGMSAVNLGKFYRKILLSLDRIELLDR